MTLAAAILAIIAGAAHVGVWAAESLFWEREPVWRLFGARSAQEAATQAGPMFNIGFYNLFLGLGAIAGGVLAVASSQWTLLVYTCLFMAGAGGVLLIRYPGLWRGALGQSAIPILALSAAFVATR